MLQGSYYGRYNNIYVIVLCLTVISQPTYARLLANLEYVKFKEMT